MASRAELFNAALCAIRTDCAQGTLIADSDLSFETRQKVADALYPPERKKHVLKAKRGVPHRGPLPNRKSKSYKY